jgi:hypothetical protein
VGGFDAVAGLQLLDGLGQLIADRAFGQLHRNIGNGGAAS